MLPVDIGVVASVAVPYLAMGADAFSKNIGEKLAGKIGELCQTVVNKFKDDSYAEQTLARAREKPASEDRQTALKAILAEKMESDQNFSQKVTELIEKVQKEQGSTRTIFNQQGQTILGSQTNISGNVQGNVFSGSFSDSVNTVKPE